MADCGTIMKLRALAAKYENEGFIKGDPSFFMHQVEGDVNRETAAFVASVLSFGARRQFMPKIASIVAEARGDVAGWIADGRFEKTFAQDDESVFYRFYKRSDMRAFFDVFRGVFAEHGSLGARLRKLADGKKLSGKDAVSAIVALFGSTPLVPSSDKSACKRICMFLRWMTRSSSPVDLGLWDSFVDRASLVMPLDTHVICEARKLGMFPWKAASMQTALKLTAAMEEIFPGDPLKADFALFGLGVDS